MNSSAREELFSEKEFEQAKEFLIKEYDTAEVNYRISLLDIYEIKDIERCVVDWANACVVFNNIMYTRSLPGLLCHLDRRQYKWTLVNILTTPVIGHAQYIPEIYEKLLANNDMAKRMLYHQIDYLYISNVSLGIIDLLIKNKIPGHYNKKTNSIYIQIYPYTDFYKIKLLIDILIYNI